MDTVKLTYASISLFLLIVTAYLYVLVSVTSKQETLDLLTGSKAPLGTAAEECVFEEPVVTEPVVIEPVVIEPVVIEPAVVEFAVVKAEVIEPVVNESLIQEPTVAKKRSCRKSIASPYCLPPCTSSLHDNSASFPLLNTYYQTYADHGHTPVKTPGSRAPSQRRVHFRTEPGRPDMDLCELAVYEVSECAVLSPCSIKQCQPHILGDRFVRPYTDGRSKFFDTPSPLFPSSNFKPSSSNILD